MVLGRPCVVLGGLGRVYNEVVNGRVQLARYARRPAGTLWVMRTKPPGLPRLILAALTVPYFDNGHARAV